MNVHATMRMAAAGAGSYDPAEWVQIRLSMMDTILPWQDPDGAFVSLTEDATGRDITVDWHANPVGYSVSWPI